MLKLIAAEDSLEEKRLTGTETSPKEIVAEPIDLAAMWGLDIAAGVRPRKKPFQVEHRTVRLGAGVSWG
jgi:hypothetical protein